MPATISPKTSHRHQPYHMPNQHSAAKCEPDDDAFMGIFTSAEEESKTKEKGSSATSSSTQTTPTKAKPQAWSGEELKMLFQHAIKNGAPGSDKGWEGVVPGKSGQQARNAWRFNVVPNVSKYLESK